MTDTVYYTCSFVPPELIRACGFCPQRLIPTLTGTQYFQTEGMCSFTNAWLQSLSTVADENGKCIAVFTTSCDQMRRAYDFMHNQNNIHAFLLDIPKTLNKRSLEYYQDELRRLMSFLCEISGQSANGNHFIPYTQKTGIRQTNNDSQNTLQIAITGGSLPDPILKSIDGAAKSANMRINLNVSENKLMPCITNQNKPLSLKELAEAYFHIPAIWKRPNNSFYEWFLPQIDNSIDGVLLFRHIFCDLWHSQVFELKKRLSVPVLEIELDGKDTLSAAAVSRLQAFLETLA